MNPTHPPFRSEAGRRPSHLYADGRPYRAPRSAFAPALPGAWPLARPAFDIAATGTDWPRFWNHVQRALRNAQFQPGTLRVYRQILRSFRNFLQQREADRLPPRPAASPNTPATAPPPSVAPRRVTAAQARAFICAIANDHASWIWQAINVAVLRTAFDKLGGRSLTDGLCTPKRSHPLPEVVCATEAARLMRAATCVRDQVLVGMLYGSGLKVGEACALRWADVHLADRELNICFAGGTRTRRVLIPQALIAVLTAGVAHCEPHEYVLAGARPGRPLTTRMAERIVKRTAMSARILKEVCCMSLRHGYALDCLRQGMRVRELQEALGHKRIETTLRYERYLVYEKVVSPADRLPSPHSAPTRPPSPLPVGERPARHSPSGRRRVAPSAGRVRGGPVSLPPAPPDAPCLPSLPTPPIDSGVTFPFASDLPPAAAWRTLWRTQLAGRFLALRRWARPSSRSP